MKLNFKLVLSLVLGTFIVYKIIGLSNYTIYEGKIIGFESVDHEFHTKSGKGHEKRSLNIVEYCKDNKIIKYTDGDSFMFNFFSKGERIKILENKNDKNDIRIFSLFHYWISIQEFILISLLLVIIYGYFKVFVTNKI